MKIVLTLQTPYRVCGLTWRTIEYVCRMHPFIQQTFIDPSLWARHCFRLKKKAVSQTGKYPDLLDFIF